MCIAEVPRGERGAAPKHLTSKRVYKPGKPPAGAEDAGAPGEMEYSVTLHEIWSWRVLTEDAVVRGIEARGDRRENQK